MGYSNRDLERYGGVAFRSALVVLRNEADAMDVAQETVLRLVRAELPPDDPLGWCHRVAANLSKNHRRDTSRRSDLARTKLGRTEAFDPHHDEHMSVGQLLARLPRRAAQVVVHRVRDGLSTSEIANRLGVSARTVRNDLARVRAATQDDWGTDR